MQKFLFGLLGVFIIILAVVLFLDLRARGVFLPKASFAPLQTEINSCFRLHLVTDTNRFERIIINSAEQYEKFRTEIDIYCTGQHLPNIDFNAQTVLGSYAQGSCGASFERDIRKDDVKKIVQYSVAVKNHFCRSGPPRIDLNLIAVPKISSDYQIIFKNTAPPPSGTIRLLPSRDCITQAEYDLMKRNNIGVRGGDVKICP